MGREHLNRHRPVQLGVKPLEHDAHATRPDHSLDFVATQASQQLGVTGRREEIERERLANGRNVAGQGPIDRRDDRRGRGGVNNSIRGFLAEHVAGFFPPGRVPGQFFESR